MSRDVLVNRAFSMQRVTGQQRYAQEIAARLLERPGFVAIEPRGWWRGSALRVWAWVLLVLGLQAGRAVVLSLTARAPLLVRNQVLVVHDLFVLTNPEWFSRRYVWTHAPLLSWQLRSARAVVAVSEPVARQVAERYAGPVVVAPNAPSEVFLEAGAPPGTGATPAALSERGLLPGSYFLTVGSLDPRKNLPTLAAAYARLSEQERAACPLVVVGGGAAVFRSEQIAWPSGVVDAGYVSDPDLRDLYAHARSVVFVTLAEGFGLPLVEAAAAGAVGLVLSDIEVFRWICGDGAVYVDPQDPASIAAGLSRALDAPEPIRIDLSRFTWEGSAAIVAQACSRAAG